MPITPVVVTLIRHIFTNFHHYGSFWHLGLFLSHTCPPLFGVSGVGSDAQPTPLSNVTTPALTHDVTRLPVFLRGQVRGRRSDTKVG